MAEIISLVQRLLAIGTISILAPANGRYFLFVVASERPGSSKRARITGRRLNGHEERGIFFTNLCIITKNKLIRK